MAERVVLVCDVCGGPAQQSVTFQVGSRRLAQDLCATDLQELVRASHAPKRGRRRTVIPRAASAPAAQGTRPRRGGTRSSASKKRAPAKRQRRRITDPATLEKRRAALAKARKALAAKRAAAKKTS